jgi:enoyl-CoA hydratase/carnithine racemase
MLITCPKPLIAAVNGPAAGFGVSLVSLCDFVFATNQVYGCLQLFCFTALWFFFGSYVL